MYRFRSILFACFMATSALVIGFLCIPSLVRRRWALAVSKFWATTCLHGLNWICGIQSRVTGAERLPEGPALIAAKHQSMWETLYLTAALPAPCFVLKQELRGIPVFGWWCARSGFIFIDRLAGAQALRDMLEKSKAAIAGGASHIIIFPEGTRVAPGERGQYQPGVAALAKGLKLPTVPVAHNSGTYWRHHDGRKLPGIIDLTFFSPLPADTPRATLMQRLEEIIETATRGLEAGAPAATGTPPGSTPTGATSPQETRHHG